MSSKRHDLREVAKHFQLNGDFVDAWRMGLGETI